VAGKWYFNIHTAANKGGEIRRSAGHAGATADLELTFKTDHSVGADHAVQQISEVLNNSLGGRWA
jgi:hypothetical protein